MAGKSLRDRQESLIEKQKMIVAQIEEVADAVDVLDLLVTIPTVVQPDTVYHDNVKLARALRLLADYYMTLDDATDLEYRIERQTDRRMGQRRA